MINNANIFAFTEDLKWIGNGTPTPIRNRPKRERKVHLLPKRDEENL